MSTRQICLDTETTGINAESGDRIVEIGCFEIVGRTLSDDPSHVYWAYINPERDVPDEAVAIHGLTNEFLADKPVFADVADDFLKFIKGAELIIHNAKFDVGFLNAELKRIGKGRVEDYCSNVIDTLAMAREIFPGLRNTLDVLCGRYGVDRSARTLHGASLDARLLGEVYLAMTRRQESLIGDTVEEMLKEGGTISMPDNKLLLAASCPDEEMAVHKAFIENMNKKSKKGPGLWTTKLGSPESTVPQPAGSADAPAAAAAAPAQK